MARTMANFWEKTNPYEQWVATLGVPIHRGYYIEEWNYAQKKAS